MRARHVSARWIALAGAVAALLVVGPAFAGEFVEGDVYRLAAGQVVEDDLTVTAREVYIDGTVQGDVIAMAGYVEVNGVVEGDLMAAGGEVRINGEVNDDARVGGAGVIVAGTVGDDLYAAAGGGEGQFTFDQVSGRQVRQGLLIEPGAVIGGAAFLGAGEAIIKGTIEEDLAVGAGIADLSGTVGGDANLSVSRLSISEGAQVQGSLSYTSERETSVPPGVASEVQFTPAARDPNPAAPANAFTGWSVMRLILTLLGFALLGWLVLRFAPNAVTRPAEALAARPGQAALFGLAALVLLFLVPILSGLIFFAVLVFWGWLPALMFALLLTAALVLAWTLSPLITGLWIGRLVWTATGRAENVLAALLVGIALVVLASMLPIVGWLVGAASLVLALGAILVARRGGFDAPVPTVSTAPTPA